MVAATASSIPTSVASGSRRTAHAAAALSLLLHLMAAQAWIWPRLSILPADSEPPAITVDIVPQPEEPPGKKEAEAAPPAPSPQAPEAKQIPQLDQGLVADRSPPQAVTARKLPVTRNERDLVLSQVLRHWKPPAELRAFDAAEFKVRVTVLADGTFAPPFSIRAPYNPAAAIEGFDGLHPQDPRRRATEAFYRALRQAQPLKLPADLAAKAPFPVMLDFRVKDVR